MKTLTQIQSNTMSSSKSSIAESQFLNGHKNNIAKGISIKYRPGEKALERIAPLWNAIDTMIVHNCFTDNNPMRVNSSDTLFWDWTIVTVNGFSVPTPIHTCSKTESSLYTFNNEEIILSNEECAYITAVFYLEHLMCMAKQWDSIKNKLHPFLGMMVGQGARELQSLQDGQYEAIIFLLKSKLSSKGFRILD